MGARSPGSGKRGPGGAARAAMRSNRSESTPRRSGRRRATPSAWAQGPSDQSLPDQGLIDRPRGAPYGGDAPLVRIDPNHLEALMTGRFRQFPIACTTTQRVDQSGHLVGGR